jgi:hypothetical protein
MVYRNGVTLVVGLVALAALICSLIAVTATPASTATPTLKFSTQQAGLVARRGVRETAMSSTWVVPSVPISAYTGSRIMPNEESWVWMGATNTLPRSLIQVGVAASTTTTATSVNFSAFWNLGAGFKPHLIAHLVAQGDAMRATIAQRAPGAKWVVTLVDTTKGWRFEQSVPYRGSERFPLWFDEAPLLTSGRQRGSVASFAPMDPVRFKDMQVNGKAPDPGNSTYIEMVNTTTGQAGVPHYTAQQDSLTIGQTSADSVLAHNPL